MASQARPNRVFPPTWVRLLVNAPFFPPENNLKACRFIGQEAGYKETIFHFLELTMGCHKLPLTRPAPGNTALKGFGSSFSPGKSPSPGCLK
ncbi:hypothetical protein X474_00475 [Dethiosulfatarculus sandiegensis]|uniref:Uncharacterized protein n=1 Tax=Dethiosulfatarculus sandiegensis TaxID=1429043 RepID=A0A0D2K3B6_9BACT|nr:hypothetical protein X474_00475 [Dethiosulfatarculus sandiegensis]